MFVGASPCLRAHVCALAPRSPLPCPPPLHNGDVHPSDSTLTSPYLWSCLGAIVQDLPADYCQQILSTTDTLPPDLANLAGFLSAPPSVRVPIIEEVYSQLPTDMRQNFIPARGLLALTFTYSLFPIHYDTASTSASEHMTVSTSWRLCILFMTLLDLFLYVRLYPWLYFLSVTLQLLMESRHVVEPLLAMDEMAGPLRIGMQLERDTGACGPGRKVRCGMTVGAEAWEGFVKLR